MIDFGEFEEMVMCEECGFDLSGEHYLQCTVCDENFCDGCSPKGKTIKKDGENHFVCRLCFERGLEYINRNNYLGTTFTEEEISKAK